MQRIEDILHSLETEERLRKIPGEDVNGLTDLSSNDYLGLGAHYDMYFDEFRERYPSIPFTSSASRLLASRQKYHNALEKLLQDLYRRPALLFNSGYHANTGCISALNLPGTLFICDKLVHASVIDGLRIGAGNFKRFPHNDIKALLGIIEKEHSNYERIIIVVEGIYSMDGDTAPLAEIAEIKKIYPNVTIYLDEAHSFGVRGNNGLGLAEEMGLTDMADIIILTFGKAAASSGAAAICSHTLKSFFINHARSFIFSTALPPANCAWTMLMIEKIIDMDEQRKHLKKISTDLNNHINKFAPVKSNSQSQIIPFITGDASKAIRLATALQDDAILALPIRRPTVPPGGERIRLSLNTSITGEGIKLIGNLIKKVWDEI